MPAPYHPDTHILIKGLHNLSGGQGTLYEWDMARRVTDSTHDAAETHPNTHIFDMDHQMETFHQLELTPMEPRLGEVDPTGRDAHAPGAKLDAGKAEFDMVLFSFPHALAAVNAIGALGAVKYTKGGFLEVPDGVRRYLNADMRHKVKHESGELNDPDTGHLHLAHAAWNAIARLELYLRGKA